MDVGKVTLYPSFFCRFPQLVQLLESDSEEVKEAAALALANLTTCNPANAKQVQRCSLNTNILAFKEVYIFFQMACLGIIPL